MGQIFACQNMRIMPPAEEKVVTDYVSTFPRNLRKSAEQVNVELAQHGYKIYKFISKCKNGFVLSAKKGRVRFAIKVRSNVVEHEFTDENILEKNRELVDNLRYYNHPNIISIIESFETKSHHYVVTEECICTLKEFVEQVKPLASDDEENLCFARYAHHLSSALQYLMNGPNHISSTRFIGYISPNDVLVSYNSELKLNPDFGYKSFFGMIPFCNPKLTSLGKPCSAQERFAYCYSHLLMYLTGLTERNISTVQLKRSVELSTKNDDVHNLVSRVNKSDIDTYKLNDIYDPVRKLEFLSVVKIAVDDLDQALFSDLNGDTVFALGKGKCISLESYKELYEFSKQKIPESDLEANKTFLEEESQRIEWKLRKIKFVKAVFSKPYGLKQWARELNRQCSYIFNKVSRLAKNSLRFPEQLKEFIEKKKQLREQEAEENEENAGSEGAKEEEPELMACQDRSFELPKRRLSGFAVKIQLPHQVDDKPKVPIEIQKKLDEISLLEKLL